MNKSDMLVWAFCLLYWGPSASATRFGRFDMNGGNSLVGKCNNEKLSRQPSGSQLQCALLCLEAGDACVGFRRSSTCVLFSALFEGGSGTYSRHRKRPPVGYSSCGRIAYRVYPPMSRDAIKGKCAADGGRMAIPLTATERCCVQHLLYSADTTPGFNPANLENSKMGYLGVLVHGPGPNFRTTDLENVELQLPQNVWLPGRPDGNRDLTFVILYKELYADFDTSAILMNVCELVTPQ